jgi:hypothetical protein
MLMCGLMLTNTTGGSTLLMGSDRHYPEEAPVHRVTVAAFWVDRTPVTAPQSRARNPRSRWCRSRWLT